MGQEDIIKFLKQRKGNKFSGRQISDNVEIGYSSIITSLRGLRSTKSVKFKKVEDMFVYWID